MNTLLTNGGLKIMRNLKFEDDADEWFVVVNGNKVGELCLTEVLMISQYDEIDPSKTRGYKLLIDGKEPVYSSYRGELKYKAYRGLQLMKLESMLKVKEIFKMGVDEATKGFKILGSLNAEDVDELKSITSVVREIRLTSIKHDDVNLVLRPFNFEIDLMAEHENKAPSIDNSIILMAELEHLDFSDADDIDQMGWGRM